MESFQKSINVGGSDTSDLIAAGLQRIATIINSSKLCEDNLFQENLQSDSEYFVHTHIACHKSLTFWINVQVQEHHPRRWADLTLDLHTSLSHGSTSLRFHSQRDLSVNVFHDILGRPGSRFLYGEGCLDCTTRAFNMLEPAKLFLSQDNIEVINFMLHQQVI